MYVCADLFTWSFYRISLSHYSQTPKLTRKLIKNVTTFVFTHTVIFSPLNIHGEYIQYFPTKFYVHVLINMTVMRLLIRRKDSAFFIHVVWQTDVALQNLGNWIVTGAVVRTEIIRFQRIIFDFSFLVFEYFISLCRRHSERGSCQSRKLSRYNKYF